MSKFRKDSGIAKLRDLAYALESNADELKAIARSLGEGNPAARILISAITEPLLAEDALFPKRLAQDMGVVYPLTRYYANQQGTIGRFPFFESGTTPVWLAINLVELETTDFEAVITNNRAVSDVLCSFCRVWETEGWADTKYQGLYPFTSDGSDIDRDAINLQRLHSSLVKRVDHLVLDASYFSFLVGPTVNSWQNVCYKAAAYNVDKPIDLLLPDRKLITEVGSPSHVESGEFVNTLSWHLANCFTVFNVPRVGESARILLPDIAQLSCKGSGISRFPDVTDLLAMKLTWLDVAASNPNLRVWVGCPNENRAFAVKEHLEEVNQVLDADGQRLRWSLEHEGREGRMSVLVFHSEVQA